MRFVGACLFLLLLVDARAQQRDIDSIEQQLKGTLPDSVRVISLMRIAVKYETFDTVSSAIYYRKAIDFVIGKNLPYKAAVVYQNQAYLFMNQTHYQEALSSLDTALVLCKSAVHPRKDLLEAQIYSAMANTYRYLTDYKNDIRYYTLAIAIYARLGQTANLVNAYNNLSSVYQELHEYAQQEITARKALEYANITRQPVDYFKSYYSVLLALVTEDKIAEARPYLDSAKKYYDTTYESNALISYYLTAGLLHMTLNELDAAQQDFGASLAIAEKNLSKFSAIQSRAQLGRVLTLQKKYREAGPILLTAYHDAMQTGEGAQISTIRDYLSRLYEASGDYRKALEYHQEFKNMSDSISSRDNKAYATRTEIEYKTQEKEAAIRQLKADREIQQLSIQRKNVINILLILAAVAVIMISILLQRNYRHQKALQQRRIAELETEKRLSDTSAVLKGEEQERTRIARDLHDGLGGMLSGIKYSLRTMKGDLVMTADNAQAFERSIDMLDSSMQEMRRVAHNMMPESLLKFGLDMALKDYCGDINATGALVVTYQSIGLTNGTFSQSTSITLYRIVQELVHNALKHAHATTLFVQVGRTDQQISITVEDDGKGFDTALLDRSQGIGWINIRNRVAFIKGTLDLRSDPGLGTSVHIQIPVNT